MLWCAYRSRFVWAQKGEVVNIQYGVESVDVSVVLQVRCAQNVLRVARKSLRTFNVFQFPVRFVLSVLLLENDDEAFNHAVSRDDEHSTGTRSFVPLT